MDLVDADSLTLCDEGIKDILAEVFTFNDYFLLVGVAIWVVSRESVDTVRLLADTRCDGPWIESKHASTSNDTDLRPFWHQDSQARFFKPVLDVCLQVRTLRETTDHEDEVHR